MIEQAKQVFIPLQILQESIHPPNVYWIVVNELTMSSCFYFFCVVRSTFSKIITSTV